jgi:hypothetical protein
VFHERLEFGWFIVAERSNIAFGYESLPEIAREFSTAPLNPGTVALNVSYDVLSLSGLFERFHHFFRPRR